MYSCILIWCISACDVLRIQIDRKKYHPDSKNHAFLLTGYFLWWFIADLFLCGIQENQFDLRSRKNARVFLYGIFQRWILI